MKNRIILSAAIMSFILLFSACSGAALSAYNTFSLFGCQTTWAFLSRSQEQDKTTWEHIVDLAARVERSVSLAEEESAVSRFNRAPAGATVEIDAIAYEILQTACAVYGETEGAYNPATGIYVDVWGFSPRCCRADYAPQEAYDRADYTQELPSDKYIHAFRSLTDFSEVEISEENGRYFLKKPLAVATVDGVDYTMQLNLGGIAKGYCADEAEKILRAAGYEAGYLSLGASSLAVLADPTVNSVGNGLWAVGVNSPRGDLGERIMQLYLKDCSVSSSGDGEQFYELNGKRYCHIIDPSSGYPVGALSDGGVIAVTLSGVSGARGDALATALIVMGRDRAMRFAQERLSACGVVMLEEDGRGNYTLYTNVPEGSYRILNENCKAVRI